MANRVSFLVDDATKRALDKICYAYHPKHQFGVTAAAVLMLGISESRLQDGIHPSYLNAAQAASDSDKQKHGGGN